MRTAIVALLLAVASPAAGAPDAPAPPDARVAAAAPGLAAVRPDALSANTRFLSAGALEGRTPGSRGHDVAALFVATRMQALGLEPAAGDGRWEQEVPLRAWRLDPEASGLTVRGPGQAPTWLVRDQDFVALSDGELSEVELEGPVAFVGYGISAPEYGYDDLKGVSLEGKIAVVLWGAPSSDRPNFFPPAPRAAYADRAAKLRRLAGRGAAGVILVYGPEAEESLPWEDFVRSARTEGMGWLDRGRLGDGVEGLPARAVVSLRGLEKIAAAAGVPGGARGILEKADANRLAAQDWPIRARIRSRADLRETRSANVLGMLRGADAARSGEIVVVTAHLDHLGVGEPGGGDAVHDGDTDDAVGVAVLLEMARAFAAMPRRPARSVLFAAVTGAEQGLVGSSYLARHPVVPGAAVVAVLNVDGAPTAFPLLDVVAHGSAHSSLGAEARLAAAALGLELSPDPAPRASAFVRSDQYSFVREGVPALHVTPGPKLPPGEDPEARRRWGRARHHTPGDGWNPAWRWDDAARFARLQFLLAWLVADGAERPRWNEGDFFARVPRPEGGRR